MWKGNIDLLEFLVSHVAHANAKDNNGKTPFDNDYGRRIYEPYTLDSLDE